MVSCGRKSNGILAAVTPCLQIASIKPMFASESPTQVLLFVFALLGLFGDLSHIIYDNACGIVRHLRKQLAKKEAAHDDTAVAWSALLALQWVIDRLHFTYHRACRRRMSAWFVDGVDPGDHPILHGIDTEAAEQIFHIANRWQTTLSNSAPVHQELFLLIFAREHNRAHSCDEAISKYRAAQAKGQPPRVATQDQLPADGACMLPTRRRAKLRKVVQTPPDCADKGEGMPAGDASIGAVTVAASPDLQGASASSSTLAPAGRLPRYAVLNAYARSPTVHRLLLQSDVYTECGWSFQGRAQATTLEALRGRQYHTCGTCYGERVLLD